MPVLIVASSEPRVGRSLIAAALAYRAARDGKAVTLVRLTGDESAEHDAGVFAAIERMRTPGKPLSAAELAVLATSGSVIVEAPPGPVDELARTLKARVISVGTADDGASGDALISLPEDRTLAAPSVRDIAAVLKARWLVENAVHGAIERVMIGTVSSDAASPYFGARERKCVVTRFDKTDIQLAALQTDLEVLVLTGGGQPSPYLLDRVAGTRDDVSVLLADADTPDAMRLIDGLFGRSRFEGQGKLDRAVAMLDEAGVAVEF